MLLLFCGLIMAIIHTSVPLNLQSISNATLNLPYSLTINNTFQQALEYTFTENTLENLKTANLRIEVEVLVSGDDDRCPLLFTVQKGKEVISWEIPHKEGDEIFKSGGRTLCIDPNIMSFYVVVVVSTCSQQNIIYTTIMKLDYGLLVPMNETINANISLTSPRYYRFEFPPGMQTILVKVESSVFDCMILSLQRPQCPVFDLESNIQYSGFWQTVSHLAGVTVEEKDFKEGFFLVFTVLSNNKSCINTNGFESNDRMLPRENIRVKPISFSIKRVLHRSEYTFPIFIPIIFYIPLILLTVIIFYTSHNYLFYRSHPRKIAPPNAKVSNNPMRSGKVMRLKKDIDELDNAILHHLQKSSLKFLWVTITVAVFYCLPVFQLIVNYLNVVYRTGEQDVCYYNNLCSLPFGSVMDFNHIYSNIGYILLGPVFMIFVRLRQSSIVTSKEQDKEGKSTVFMLRKIVRDVEHGTFQHYGNFYALGVALLMEGFLSGGYHICPNKSNFQFDTSFMYAMAILSYIKVYQFRHPLHMSESLIFISLAIVTACVVVGLISESLPFNIVISCCYIAIVVMVQLYLVYNARTFDVDKREKDPTVMFGILKELFGLQNEPNYLVKNHPNKVLFWWTMVGNALLIICLWTLLRGNNFATQVLYVLLFNLAIYVFYYGIMKCVHGEWMGLASVQPAIYGLLALVFWVPGLYLFMNPLSVWDVSPAESRTNNEECIFANFYDNHDLWHFLSAGGLFYTFLFFLTMDDRLIKTHQSNIPMF